MFFENRKKEKPKTVKSVAAVTYLRCRWQQRVNGRKTYCFLKRRRRNLNRKLTGILLAVFLSGELNIPGLLDKSN